MNILVVLKKCVPLIIVTLHKKKRRMQSLLIVRNILCYPQKDVLTLIDIARAGGATDAMVNHIRQVQIIKESMEC